MDVKTIQMLLNAFDSDQTLEIETNLGRRLNVIDLIDFTRWHDRTYHQAENFSSVDEQLANFKRHLTGLNTRLFERLRTQIRARAYTPAELRLEFNRYTAYTPGQPGRAHIAPDALDALLDNVLGLDVSVGLTEPPTPDMIPYTPTPARAVLEAVDSAGLQPGDVFYDLGSGLGRVVILAHLVSGARAKGVEINPDLHRRAEACARGLALSGVEFIHGDVRSFDYEAGSVFFMYTPFTGDIFEAALDRLRQVAQLHPIRVCTFGPCTAWAAEQPWLHSEAVEFYDPAVVVTFYSRPLPPKTPESQYT